MNEVNGQVMYVFKSGQIETVQHYLLQCQLYEEERNILYNRLQEQLGIHTPNVYTLLGYEGHREISTWREQIMQEVGEYINVIFVPDPFKIILNYSNSS